MIWTHPFLTMREDCGGHKTIYYGSLTLRKYTKRKKATKSVPLGHHFKKWCLFWQKGHYFGAPGKVWKISALFGSGTKTVPQKVLFYGRSNGATVLVSLIYLSVYSFIYPIRAIHDIPLLFPVLAKPTAKVHCRIHCLTHIYCECFLWASL